MATAGIGVHQQTRHDPRGVSAYSLVLSSVFGIALFVALRSDPAGVGEAFVVFVVVAACADMMRIRLGPEMTFAVSLPVVLAAGMILAPWQAGLVGFLGTIDLREFRREVPLPRALFNRSLVGLCALCASATFHALDGDPSLWPAVLLPALVSLAVDVVLNALLVAWPVARLHGVTFWRVLHALVEPDPFWSGVRYACTGLMAPLLAAAWLFAGFFGLLASLLPIAMAWLAFREAGDLSDAKQSAARSKEALAVAVKATASERNDERKSLAGDLHDEVLPALFKVHLMGEVIRHDLAAGRLLDLEEDVDSLLEATEHAQASARGLVGSLRTSPLGSRGLEGTLRFLVESTEAQGAPRIELRSHEVRGAESVQVVAYQVAREALTNSAKYAKASKISIYLGSDEDELCVEVIDDGVGFDARIASSEPGHFGLSLMRERVEAVGGRLTVDSRLGGGTRIHVRLPLAEGSLGTPKPA